MYVVANVIILINRFLTSIKWTVQKEMDIRQLRYFVTIVEENNNITQAAKRLNMAQPPLSQQLKVLEHGLGVELFERRKKKLILTLAGKALYDRAVHMLRSFDETVTEIRDIEHGIKGQLSIGVTAFYSYMLPDQIKSFRDQYPEVTFRIIQGDANRLTQLLKNGDIEIAIVNLPVEAESTGINTILLTPVCFSFFAPEYWKLSREKKEMNFAEIEKIPLILTRREKGGGGTYDAIIEEAKRLNVKLNIICECNDIQMALSLTEKGIGAAIMPDYILNHYSGHSLQPYQILDFALKSESALMYSNERYLSKVANRFINVFTEEK